MKNIIIRNFGYPDVFVEHGTPKELEQMYKIDEKSVVDYIKNTMKYKKKNNNANYKKKKNINK